MLKTTRVSFGVLQFQLAKMSETLSLIPNLNEMMEEYMGNEVEVTQEPLTIVTHEERLETRT